MDYLIKASGLVVILVLFYQMFLKNETFFKSIRSYFLIGLFITISIPLVQIPIYLEKEPEKINSFNFSNIIENQPLVENTFDLIQALTQLYILGVIILSATYLVQLMSLLMLIINHKKIKQGNLVYIETSKNITPFSFFNYIIYNKNQFSIVELEQIINHEKVHANQLHSFDTVLSHILVILLWFNPFSWYFKKLIQQNLEYLADSYAVNQSENQKLYKFTLLKAITKNNSISITNNFYNSLIKKRIIMLHKNQSKKMGQWKYALLFPILIAFVFTFNTKIIAQENYKIELNESKIELIINKNSTDELLNKESKFFKKVYEIELNFKNIKRNSNSEITAIRIEADGKNTQATFENSGAQAIEPIKITFDSQSNSIGIVNVSTIKDNIHSYSFQTSDKDSLKNKEMVFITSDGNKMKWLTEKDNDSITMSGNKIIWHKENDNNMKVKVIKTDDLNKEHVVKVSSAMFISDDGKKTEFIIDEDNASENVFIIKNDSEKGQKHKIVKTESQITFKSDKKIPLYILDKKEIEAKQMENIDPNTIASINVLKGKMAIEKYGEKGKNGVIEITTKEK